MNKKQGRIIITEDDILIKGLIYGTIAKLSKSEKFDVIEKSQKKLLFLTVFYEYDVKIIIDNKEIIVRFTSPYSQNIVLRNLKFKAK